MENDRRVVLDRTRNLDVRLAAADRLAGEDAEAAMETLLRVTEDAEEDVGVHREMGRRLGQICSDTRPLTEFEMANMSGTAYDAYCDELR